jgi:hypothetical protein
VRQIKLHAKLLTCHPEAADSSSIGKPPEHS